MNDSECIHQAETAVPGAQWSAMQDRDPFTKSFPKTTPPDAVYHVYIPLSSTLVTRAKLQTGVSLAVLWRGVAERSFVGDTKHCLIGTNFVVTVLWLASSKSSLKVGTKTQGKVQTGTE